MPIQLEKMKGDEKMKFFKTSLSVTLALIMLLSVFVAAPVSSNAATAKTVKSADPNEGLPAIEDVSEIKVKNLTFTEGLDSYLQEETVNGQTVRYYRYSLTPTFTATIGNVVFSSDEDGDLQYDGHYYKLEIIDDQAYDNVWKAGEHTVKAKFQGVETTFTVKIKESPFESITFSDITLSEGFDSREISSDVKIDETETSINWNIYDYTPKYTVKLKNGSTIESDSMGYLDYNNHFLRCDCYDDQAYNNEWEKGEHNVKCYVAGFEDSFKVNIEDTIIDKIVVDNITLYENIGNEPNEHGNTVYEYYPNYKVYLKDGTVVDSDDFGGVTIHGKYDTLTVSDDQLTNPWTVGEHTATGKIYGIETPIKVTVNPSLVEKIEVKDLTLYKGGDDEEAYYYDEENETQKDWMKFEYCPEFTVVLKDGTKIESEDGGIVFNGSFYTMSISDDQSYNTPWDIGNHKAEGTLFGFKSEFNVTVEECPVKELKVNNMEIVEFTNGSYDEDDENRPFIYEHKVTDFEVEFKNGSIIKSDGNDSITYGGRDYKITTEEIDKQYTSEWKKGNSYKVNAYIMGVKKEFEVKIIESPAKSLTVEPIELVANWDGFEDDEMGIFYYTIPQNFFNYVVTLSDGTELQSKDGCVNYKGVKTNIEYKDNQSYNNEWKAGNTYTINTSVLGVSAKVKVTLVESVVESISVNDLKLKEKVDGFIDTGLSESGVYESYFKYDVNNPSYSVKLKDGTILNPNETGKLEYKNRIYYPNYISDQSYINAWKPGYHKAQIEILGGKAEYNVIVEGDTPIEPPTNTEAATDAPDTEPTTDNPEATTEPVSTDPITTEPDSTAQPTTDAAAAETTTAAPEATTQPDETQATEATTAAPTSNVQKTQLTLKKSKAVIYVKGTVKIKASVKNGKGAIKYKSNKPKIAKVDKNGKVTALKKGKAKITVSNNGVKKTFTVTVKNPKLKKAKKTLKRGKSFTIKITGKKGTAKFKSGNKRIATVSKKGKIKALRKGKVTITVTTNGKIKLKFKLTVK